MGRWSGSALASPAHYGGTLQVLSMYLELKAYWKPNRVSICSEVTRSVVPGCGLLADVCSSRVAFGSSGYGL